MKHIRPALVIALSLLLAACGDSDKDRKERAEQFTTSTRPAPNPRQEDLGDLLRSDSNEGGAGLSAPKFSLYSEYKGEDIRQVTGVSGRSLLLCFTAPWCTYCSKMRKNLQTLAKSEKGSIQVVEINADEYPALAQQFNISKVPTTILYTEGVKLRSIEGAYTTDSVRAYLHKVLSLSDDPTSKK